MEKKSEASFPDLPRYEQTLKERLATGEVFRHCDGGFENAQMLKVSGLIVISCFTGTHTLHFESSNTRRIEAHWTGFCEICDKARAEKEKRALSSIKAKRTRHRGRYSLTKPRRIFHGAPVRARLMA
jgi:hypothetical protein